jgi:hypothetical protein
LNSLPAFTLCLALAGCATGGDMGTGAGDRGNSSLNGIRFAAHRIAPDLVRVVARGKPGQSTQEVQEALSAHLRKLCGNASRVESFEQSEYEYLEDGNSYFQHVAGLLLPKSTFHVIKQAPLVSGSFQCRAVAGSDQGTIRKQASIRLEVVSELGETIPFIDQGFASFNRERLEVPISGVSLAQRASAAVRDALKARGYDAELVQSGSAADAKVVISKAAVPREQFSGIALLTKLGPFAIENTSVAFCSIGVTVYVNSGARPTATSVVSTGERMPAAYTSWARDMANGPSAATQIKTIPLLLKAMSANIKAAIHAMPMDALEPTSTSQVR